MNNKEKLQEATMRALQGKITESVSWDYFDKFKDVVHKYLPTVGEGDTFATQIVTAINMLIYKWYNDGDVYDISRNYENSKDLYYRLKVDRLIDELDPSEVYFALCDYFDYKNNDKFADLDK